MRVLYKYKSCPDGFMVFICCTTCVSMQKNELVMVMRNTERKGSTVCAVLRASTGQSRAKNKPIKCVLMCSCFEETANPLPGLTFNLLEISKAQLSLSFQRVP